MKKLAIISIISASTAIASADIVTYPAPEGANLNASYTVEVSDDGLMWHPVDAYSVKVDEVLNARHTPREVSMAYFDCDTITKVRVISNKENIMSAKVRPLSYGITPEIKGDTLLFSVSPSQLMSVEVNGDIFNNLQLFANTPDNNAPSPKQLKKLSKDKNYIYFGPGIHKIDTLRVQSGQTVYVAGGAVVQGNIEVHDAQNVRILGRGMVYPNQMGIHIARSKNVEVDGLFTTQCAVGASDSVNINNVKVMSWYGWGDGFNVFASSNVKYNNVWARTSDDCTTIYATRKGHEGSCSNILMENSVLWADVAHPIMIGLHGSFNPETPDSIVGATYRNLDILDHSENQMDYQGCLAISCGDNNLVKDITFEDIRVENFRKGQLVNMRIVFNKKYCQFPGRGIENVTFRNVSYKGDNATLSIISGYDENRKIKNILFQNLTINDKTISDSMPEKPKWYKTSDFANMYIGEHVENVTFE